MSQDGYNIRTPGTTAADSASAGLVGEFLTSTVASGSAVSLTTATPANVTNKALTAGDWDVDAMVDFSMSGATTTSCKVGVSLTSATLPSQPGGSGLGTDALRSMPLNLITVTDVLGLPTGTVRVSIAATTTVYLVAQQTFSAGSSSAYGTIRARRVR